MRIINSEIISAIPQIDGRLDVVEHHLYDTGDSKEFNYLADADLNLQNIAELRAVNINAELDKLDREEAIAYNYEIPLSPVQFIARLRPDEINSFETSTDVDMRKFWLLLNKANIIHRSNPLVIGGLTKAEQLGIISPGRKEEVLA